MSISLKGITARIGRAKLEAMLPATVLTFLIIFVSVCLLHNSYSSAALDLGLFTDTLKYTLQGNLLYDPINQSSFLSDHFSPILLFLVPIYWLFPYAQTLLVVQAVALGVSAFLAYILARSFGFSHRTSLAIECLFCINPLVWGIPLNNFHPAALAVPVLLLMLIGMVNNRKGLFITGFILSLMTKETVIIALAVFGLVMFLTKYIKERKVDDQSLRIFYISLIAYGIAVLVAIQASSGEYTKMLWYTSARYNYIDQSALYVIKDALSNFLSAESIFLFFASLIPFGFLPLLSFRWAAPGLFIIVMNMFSPYEGQHYLTQNAALTLPFLYVAFLHALSRMKDSKEIQSLMNKFTPRLATYLFEALLLIALLININPTSRFWVAHLPSEHDRVLDNIVSIVPDGATVTANNYIYPHLCNRTEAYLPRSFNEYIPYDANIVWGYPERDTEYVVIDYLHTQRYLVGHWEDIALHFIDQKYDLVAEIDGVKLYKLQQGD